MDYLEVTDQNRYLQFKTEDSTYLVPKTVANGITALTNNVEETNELINYLHDRVEEYGDTSKTVGFSPAFVEGLYVSLLSMEFSPAQIMEGLDQIKGCDLLGPIENEEGKAITIADRITMISQKVNSILEKEVKYTQEELEDEPTYHGRR